MKLIFFVLIIYFMSKIVKILLKRSNKNKDNYIDAEFEEIE